MTPLAQHTPVEGFVSTTSAVAERPNTLAKGSKNLIVSGAGRVVAHQGLNPQGGVLGARALFNLPDGGYGGLGTAAVDGIGSIVGLIAQAIAIQGQGLVTLNGVPRAINASTALQILLRRSGSWSGAGTGPYIAGLDPPTAPTIAEHSVTTSTVNSGTTSLVFWFVRSATGGRSRKSAPSNVLVVNGKKVRFTVSGADLTTASTLGYDRIGVAPTQWGFGAVGPHYAHPVNEGGEFAISSLTTVDGVANSLELEWSSAQLQNQMLAPLEDYPPPAGVFCVAIEDVLAVIGCYGDSTSGVSATSPGTAIAVSLPVYIESFPPDNLLFLPGAPVGVLSRAAEGFAFVAGRDYLCALTYTGGSPALSLQTVWPNVGIAGPNAFFIGEGGRLYAFTNGKRGIARIGEKGEPDHAFGEEVADETAAWTPANVVGGYDTNNRLVVFGHHKTLLVYNTQKEKWGAPVDITGALTGDETLAAMVNVGGTLLLAVRDTVTTGNPMRLLAFDGGTGTTYEYFTPWAFSSRRADEIFLLEVLLRADNITHPLTVKVFANGNRTTPKWTKTLTLTETGEQHLTFRPDVRGAKSHSIYLSQRSTGGDCGPDAVLVNGVPSAVVI